MPKRITAETPRRVSSSTSPTTVSTECRPSPGSSSLANASGPTKSGITKSSRWSRVSPTSPRSPLVRRKRRGVKLDDVVPWVLVDVDDELPAEDKRAGDSAVLRWERNDIHAQGAVL